jgi:hypothetical protein
MGDRYAIAMELDTRGLASMFVDLTSHSEVHGGLNRETLRPETYRADVRRNGAERHYAVDYRGDGSVTNASAPPSAGRPLLVAAEQTRGTVDQLTAYFLLELRASAYALNNFNRGLSLARPDGYKDGVKIENRYYFGSGDIYDVGTLPSSASAIIRRDLWWETMARLLIPACSPVDT